MFLLILKPIKALFCLKRAEYNVIFVVEVYLHCSFVVVIYTFFEFLGSECFRKNSPPGLTLSVRSNPDFHTYNSASEFKNIVSG
jgi:hypothetical protein